MKETIQRTDRIERVTKKGNGEPVIETVMAPLPLGRINYGGRPEGAVNPQPSSVLPPELKRLDMRQIGAPEPQVTIAFAKDNEPKPIPLNEKGEGRLDLGDGQEIVVYAADALADAQKDARDANGSKMLTSKYGLGSENGKHDRAALSDAQDKVTWGSNPGDKKVSM